LRADGGKRKRGRKGTDLGDTRLKRASAFSGSEKKGLETEKGLQLRDREELAARRVARNANAIVPPPEKNDFYRSVDACPGV